MRDWLMEIKMEFLMRILRNSQFDWVHFVSDEKKLEFDEK